MKPKSIPRGVVPQRRRMSRGERATRHTPVYDTDVPPEDRAHPNWRKTRNKSAHTLGPVILWSGILIFMTVAILAGATAIWLKPHLSAETHLLLSENNHFPTRAVRVVSKFPSPTREQSLGLVRRALAIRDPEQVEEVFRTASPPMARSQNFCTRPTSGTVVCRSLSGSAAWTWTGFCWRACLRSIKERPTRWSAWRS